MIASLRDRLSKLTLALPLRRSARPVRRVRLGYYGYRRPKPRRRSAAIALGAFAAAVVAAVAAAASGRLSY